MSKLFRSLTPKPARRSPAPAAKAETRGPARKTLAAGAGAAGKGAAGTDAAAGRPKEIGGPDGPEPTRYGDWERGGICYDF